MLRIKWWQWPNVLAIDAAMIAIAWQLTLGHSAGIEVSSAASLVLALSVWLTYSADRLFDVRNRTASTLLSVRHQFAKRHFRKLWFIWSTVLVLNIAAAFTLLTSGQLSRGLLLLTACLAYTFLNQKLSGNFPQKEFFVALIFSTGASILIEPGFPILNTIALALLCFINCLLIGEKEHAVDRALGINSLATEQPYILIPTCILFPVILVFVPETASRALSISGLAIGSLWLVRQRIHRERFRILIDLALLAGPAAHFID